MADPPSLLGDQSGNSGIWGGLLSLFRPTDPSAAYTGSLARDPTTGQMDPAVAAAFRTRALGAAAGAFAEGAMPVPYRGGVPLLATIGKAGAAASTSGDSLIEARLRAAQQQQAIAAAGLSQGQLGLLSSLGPAYQALIKKGMEGGGAGAGTGTGGASAAGGPKVGPAALLSGGGAGGVSPTDHYTFLLNNGASKNEATMLTSAANAESSFNPNAVHDGGIGYGLYGHNTDRLAAMRQFAGVGPNDPVPWQQQALYSLAELRGQVPGLPGGGEPKAGAMVNAATNPEQLTAAQLAFERPNLNIAGGNHAQRLASTTEYWNKPPYQEQPTQTASAAPATDATPANQPGGYGPGASGVYVPPGGGASPPLDIRTGRPVDPKTGAVAPPPAAPAGGGAARAPGALEQQLQQMGQRSGGLLNPQPAAAAPLPAGPAPGPTGGLLAPQPQVAAAAPPPELSPAAAAIAQGMAQGGGLPPGGQVAGPGAPSGPPPPPPGPGPMVSGLPPPSGALPGAPPGPPPGPPGGLLNQPPPAPPGAAPGGPGMPPAAPPVPPPPQAAPAPPSAPPPLGPPPALPPPPSQMPPMPPMPTPPQGTPQQMIAQGIAGISSLTGHPAPQFIQDLAQMPAQMAMEQYKAWINAQTSMMTERDKKIVEMAAAPYLAAAQAAEKLKYTPERVAPGAGISVGGQPPQWYAPERVEMFNPATQRQEWATATKQADGTTKYEFSGIPAKPSAAETGFGTKSGEIGAANAPLPAPQQPVPPPGLPPRPVYPGTPLAPGMTSKEPDYQEPQLNETQLKAGYAADNWPKTTRELTASLGPAQQAEQRLTNIASAFQQVGTRQFTTDKANWNNALDGIFGPGGGPQWLRTSTDPGAVMTALHETQRATLSNLKATNPHFANAEFQSLSKMSENPDLPISANVNMLSEDIAQLRQQQGLAQGWIAARSDGKQDPDLFQAMWLKQNPLAPITEAVKKEISIGQLAPPPGQGAAPQRANEGQTVYGPDGAEYVIHNGKPVNSKTLQPYQPPGGR